MKNYILLFMALGCFYSCSFFKATEKIKNRTWEGQIYRMDDEKRLSEVRLKFSSDTLFVFANAIFGADNDTLFLIKHEEKDSIYVFGSPSGEIFEFTYIYQKEKEKQREILYLLGDDYFVVLFSSELDISEPAALDFYKNKIVPRRAFLYLDGAVYKGTIDVTDPLMKLYSYAYGMAQEIELTFLDGFRVKVTRRMKTGGMSIMTSLLGGNTTSSEIMDYTLVGNEIRDKNGKQMGRNATWRVTEDGQRIIITGKGGGGTLIRTH